MNKILLEVTERIRERSGPARGDYLARINAAAREGPQRVALGCSNLAHGMAACDQAGKQQLGDDKTANIAIVTAYNDMLSAHRPFETYPAIIRDEARKLGAVAQVAGGVPAMCDGVTQGEPGMDLSLFSRDVIALSTAVALSHNMFDAVLCLGICDKIVPGLLIGSLSFGHLPVMFVPAGPMPSGLPNKEKAAVREAYAAGEVGRTELLAAESAAYHAPGTCTFYGTANSNQMLMEFMGLQLPGGSFINPDHPMREPLTRAAVEKVLALRQTGESGLPLGHIVNEKTIVNGMVGLLATGGSTNHTIHLIAVAAAAGIRIDWSDFSDLSKVVPLLAHVYPNGQADVNQFHAAGGLAYMIGQLLSAGLLHEDVNTVVGPGLSRFATEPYAGADGVAWRSVSDTPGDYNILRPVDRPFQNEGGLRLVSGNLGRAIVKVSAVAEENMRVTAPARVFDSQEAFVEAATAGELEQDMVAVLPGQGPASNGMPELHKLTPHLAILQNKGYKVALLTDGRMSGASGKILAAIHVTPEAAAGGWLARVKDGDVICIDAEAGKLEVEADLASRESRDISQPVTGTGRELFGVFRGSVCGAEQGATIFRQH